MKERNCLLIMCILLLVGFSSAFGQGGTKTITGVVSDSLNNPLSGVSVQVKGTQVSAVTDATGKYTIQADPNGTLVFTHVSFSRLEVRINNKSSVDVVMQQNLSNMDEVVVVGYGTQKRSHFTGASSSLNVEREKIDEFPSGRLDKALAGRFSGVEIRDLSGQVGDAPQIKVRGSASFSASSSPLIVIDGTPSADFDLSDVDMSAVKNIEILKDAASTAIYGSRGANGVVLITTKQGGGDRKPQFNVKISRGISEVIRYYDQYDVDEYAMRRWDVLVRAPWETSFLRNGLEVPASPYDANGNLIDGPGGKKYIPWDLFFSNKINPVNGSYYHSEGAGYFQANRINELLGAPTPQESVTNNSASNSSVSLSASGGNSRTGYYVSAAYRKEEGVIINNNFNTIAFTANMNSRVTDKIKIELSLKPKYQRTRRSTNTTLGGVLRWLRHPLYHTEQTAMASVRSTEGGYLLPWVGAGDYAKSRDFARMWLMNDDFTEYILNPAGNRIRLDFPSKTSAITSFAVADNNEDYQTEYKLNGNMAVQWDILQNLSLRTNFATNLQFREFDRWVGSFPNSNGQELEGFGSSEYSYQLVRGLINENTLNYTKNILDHHLNVLLGFSVEEYKSKGMEAAGRYYPYDNIRTLENAGEILIDDVNNSLSDEALVSAFGRVNYDFKDRYLLSLVMRRDGSSQFGYSRRWGNFPSVSVGWRLGEEDFIKDIEWISSLSLRASYGVTGNNRIPRYSYVTAVEPVYAIIGNGLQNGYMPSSATLGNADLGWEQTNASNIGITFGILKNRFTFDIDLYSKRTNQLLLRNPIVNITGQDNEWANVGDISNKGIDFQFNGVLIRNRNFSWDISANASHNKNKLIDYGGTEEQIFNGYQLSKYRLRVGEPIGEFYGYKTTGEIWKTQDDLNAGKASGMAFSNNLLGDLKLQDLNGDGTITDADKTVLGSEYPDIEWGLTNHFSYKNFDMAFTFQGSHGAQVWNLVNILGSNTLKWTNEDVYIDEFHGSKPIIRDNVPTESDHFVEDASYVCLRYVNLGFRIPKWKMRINLSGSNLLYLMSKDYKGINPEYAQRIGGIAYGQQQYNVVPLLRSVSLGIDFRF